MCFISNLETSQKFVVLVSTNGTLPKGSQGTFYTIKFVWIKPDKRRNSSEKVKNDQNRKNNKPQFLREIDWNQHLQTASKTWIWNIKKSKTLLHTLHRLKWCYHPCVTQYARLLRLRQRRTALAGYRIDIAFDTIKSYINIIAVRDMLLLWVENHLVEQHSYWKFLHLVPWVQSNMKDYRFESS